jgi:uncharacterized membrane protein YgcG
MEVQLLVTRRLWPALFFALFLLGALAQSAAAAQDPPIPTIASSDRGWVDTTGKVDSATLSSLRDQSDRISQIDGGSKGFQLAGVFFNDIASAPSQFASNVGNQNKIGSATNNNGVVIIVLLDRKGNDGNKPYIFVTAAGGLQGDLPDSRINNFEQQYFVPDRSSSHWQRGLITLVTKLGDFLSDPKSVQDQSSDSNTIPLWVILLALFVIIFFVVIIVVAVRKGGGGSGFFGDSSGDSGSSWGGGGSDFNGGGSGT